MILRVELPTDFWRDAYETSNYITNKIPTNTSLEYITPKEVITRLVRDLGHLQIWGV